EGGANCATSALNLNFSEWAYDDNGRVSSDGSLEHAMKRDAPLVAEYLGGAVNCDAPHITDPIGDGLGVSSCIESCLEDAGVNYIYAHATSTLAGDLAEINALKRCSKALGSKSMPLRSIEITQVQRLQMKVHKYLHEQFEVMNSPA
ncbi:unnamed protein product, partial [Brassica rapa]